MLSMLNTVNSRENLNTKTVTKITTDAQALTMAEHSGHIIMINHASAVTTMDLPAVADAVGMTLTIVMNLALTADCVIDGQENDKIRNLDFNTSDTAANIGRWTEGRYLTYDESFGSGSDGNVGDYVHLFCDGSYWHATSFGQGARVWSAAD
jgi:hypothetical protein